MTVNKKPKEKSQVVLLKELVDNLTQAIGASSQLIHALPNPYFMIFREALELTREGVTLLAPKNLMYRGDSPKVITDLNAPAATPAVPLII